MRCQVAVGGALRLTPCDIRIRSCTRSAQCAPRTSWCTPCAVLRLTIDCFARRKQFAARPIVAPRLSAARRPRPPENSRRDTWCCARVRQASYLERGDNQSCRRYSTLGGSHRTHSVVFAFAARALRCHCALSLRLQARRVCARLCPLVKALAHAQNAVRGAFFPLPALPPCSGRIQHLRSVANSIPYRRPSLSSRAAFPLFRHPGPGLRRFESAMSAVNCTGAQANSTACIVALQTAVDRSFAVSLAINGYAYECIRSPIPHDYSRKIRVYNNVISNALFLYFYAI